MKTSWTVGSRMVVAVAALACQALPIEVSAQGQVFGSDQCQFLPALAGATVPDYSVVDAMVPDAVVAGASVYPAICVSQEPKTVTWSEARPNWKVGELRDINLVRRVFFYKPTNSTKLTLPLIIWSHPNGSTEVIDDPDSTTATRIAQPAIDHGFAFMSLQFRHPTASQKWYAAPAAPLTQTENGKSPPKGTMHPSIDIAATVQWARLNADKLGIDATNIFLVGQSRGSLSVLTALMVDQKKQTLAAGDDAYLAYPSIPNAVFAAQAQTTYRDDQLRSFFLKNYASTAVTSRIVGKPLQFPLCRESGSSGRFDYWCHYNKSVQGFTNTVITPLSAVDELGKTEPPIWLRYDRKPASLTTISPVGTYVNKAGDYQDQPDIDNNAANCYEATTVADADKALKCFDVHHPHFGLTLRQT